MSRAERGEIRSYYKGFPSFAPLWFQIYAAAGENPLEAQRLENELELIWWEYHHIAQTEKAKAIKQMSK